MDRVGQQLRTISSLATETASSALAAAAFLESLTPVQACYL